MKTTKLKYTDAETHRIYRSIYYNMIRAAKYNIKQFKFDIVVYDEKETFPKDIRNDRFYYPFIDQKTVVNKLQVDYDGDDQYI